jgi:hypothetical protein
MRLDFHAQKWAKPRRCQAITVAGFTIASASGHRDHTRETTTRDHTQKLESRASCPHLVEGPHAGCLPRKKLLDVAAQMDVEVDRSDGRRHAENEAESPQESAVAERPPNEGTHLGRGGPARFIALYRPHWQNGASAAQGISLFWRSEKHGAAK